MKKKIETTGFGAPEEFGAHIFLVEVPASRTRPVTIIEVYGYKGGENGLPYEEERVILDRKIWMSIRDTAQREFNTRLKAAKLKTSRWRVGKNPVDRLLGKELCVLAWAAERAKPEEIPVICSKWLALRPEERWWLFSQTVAEAGLPEDINRGWRKALYFALSDGKVTSKRPRTKTKVILNPKELPLLELIKNENNGK